MQSFIFQQNEPWLLLIYELIAFEFCPILHSTVHDYSRLKSKEVSKVLNTDKKRNRFLIH